MQQQFEGDQYAIQEKGHGRREARFSLVEQNTELLGDIAFEWSNLTTFCVY